MLGVSMLLHAWLLESRYGKGAARSHADSASLVARIAPAATDSITEVPVESSRGLEPIGQTLVATAASGTTPSTQAAGVKSTAAATADTALLPQSSDPTYYVAGDLDVFPKALVKPDLTAALGTNHEPAAGNVRATLLIDEAGIVNAVRGVDAPAADVETTVRELLLRTRFTPARNKDGRIVKSQVRVALEYGTRTQPR
jgi:hypothetical protein